jgi:hypothetical protein
MLLNEYYYCEKLNMKWNEWCVEYTREMRTSDKILAKDYEEEKELRKPRRRRKYNLKYILEKWDVSRLK